MTVGHKIGGGFIGKEEEEDSHQESDFYLCPLLYWVQ